MHTIFLIAAVVTVFIIPAARGQTLQMDFEKYDPPSTLVVPQHIITKAQYPFIDVHNHQNSMGSGSLDELVKDMDDLNLTVMVNPSGGNGNRLRQMTDNIKRQYPNRLLYLPISILTEWAHPDGPGKRCSN